MSTNEKLEQMRRVAARNEERVKEYIEKKRTESFHRTMEVYARAVYESMDDLASGDREKRAELIEVLFNTVKAMERD